GRVEGGEVVVAFEAADRALHRREVERLVDMPRIAALDGGRPRIVPDAVPIVAQARVAPRVEIIRRALDAADRDVARRHAVEAALQPPDIDLAVMDEIRDLTQGVNARVGASRTVETNLRAEDLLQRRLDRLLHRPAVRLDLPAAIVGAVVLDRELNIHSAEC